MNYIATFRGKLKTAIKDPVQQHRILIKAACGEADARRMVGEHYREIEGGVSGIRLESARSRVGTQT